ncbi:MAG: NfeD family protein [Phycisphaeraceae bacterium]|nr:NfeD family protein [Phycisphaeraceae bacterium]
MEWIKEYLKPELIWFLVGLVMLLFEFALPGLIIFFFGVGAWVVAGLCFFLPLSTTWQLSIFLATSVVCLLVLRKAVKKVFFGRVVNDPNASEYADENVGKEAVVETRIAPHTPGKIELNGTLWKAVSDHTIEANTTVTIIAKDNLTLTVKPT